MTPYTKADRAAMKYRVSCSFLRAARVYLRAGMRDSAAREIRWWLRTGMAPMREALAQ